MPDIIKARYTGPKRPGESADRLVKYLTRRREQVREGVEFYRYREIGEVYGDPERFAEAARKRAESRNRDGKPPRSTYVHIVISPEEGRSFGYEDFGALVGEWTTGKNGEELPWCGAVHRDSEHPHLHLAVVRDKYVKRDLMEKVERTREICRERELVHGIDREEEREIERQREAEIVRERGEAELERRREEELEKRLGRERDDRDELELDF